ncbi:MAG: tyrosine--tRNA ligase [Clostridia bacterium]|nr:tyrosine--tRNA ligase [Clostridia bacterium]
MAHILDILKERGFLAQITYEEDLYKLLENESVPFYVGFDPTADSLHIGHYIPIMAMAHMQKAGHKPIALVGGGTAMVGDPSGRTDLRQMLTQEDIQHNIEGIRSQLSRFLSFEGENAAIIVNNGDWLLNLNYINFLREIGVHFSVNRMLTAECYKQRMEKGLTFLEFNYMLMQGYDFLELWRKYGCKLEMGGDDQWSNMLAGADLIRRKEHKDAFAATFQLLLTHEGKKMGKTAKGALWLDEKRTSPYDFYQYWRNVDDADVEKCLGLLTFLPMEQVHELCRYKDERINNAKKVLAFEVTKLVHGEEKATAAQSAAEALFSGGADASSIPSVTMTHAEVQGLRLIDLMVKTKLAPSLGEGRRLIKGGGVTLNGEKVSDMDYVMQDQDFPEGEAMIRRGKKAFYRVLLKD